MRACRNRSKREFGLLRGQDRGVKFLAFSREEALHRGRGILPDASTFCMALLSTSWNPPPAGLPGRADGLREGKRREIGRIGPTIEDLSVPGRCDRWIMSLTAEMADTLAP